MNPHQWRPTQGQMFTLADSFDEVGHGINMSAPLPLGHHQAIQMALEHRLRQPGLFTWAVIAEVMAHYHGLRRSPAWWQHHVRAAGAPARPRGGAFGSQEGNPTVHQRRLRSVS